VHAVASGLASALAYLHTAFDSPVIHRDVKPTKVMMRLVMRNVGTAEPVRSQFVAALGGFGTAVHLNDEARVEIDDSDPVRSKLRAPEPTCSPALDIYSLGIVLHEVLTLNIPYYNELLRGAVPIKSVLAPLRYVLAPPVDGALLDESRAIAGLPYTTTLPDDNYAPYVAICNRCLVIDPLKRPSATHLAQRLAELPEGVRARAAAAEAQQQQAEQQSRRSSPMHDDLFGVQLSSNSSSTASLTRLLHGNNNDDSSGDLEQQQQQQPIVAGSSGGRIRSSAERVSEK
jgi:serine/threonine protein kinase